MTKTVLDEAVTALVPAPKRTSVRKRVTAGAKVAVDLLNVLVVKKPALRKALEVLRYLLSPGNDNAVPVKLVTKKIRKLQAQLEKMVEGPEQEKIRRKLEGLYELLIEDGEDDDT